MNKRETVEPEHFFGSKEPDEHDDDASQLLCEQVVGRGLRRTSYELNKDTGLFDAEYVNIFGVPFTFLPHEAHDGPPPPPPSPKTRIEPVKEKQQYEIHWPNIVRLEHVFRPKLTLDMNRVRPLKLDAYETATLAELAPVVDGKPDITQISQIDLENLANQYRWQRVIFTAAVDVYSHVTPGLQEAAAKRFDDALQVRHNNNVHENIG